MRTVKSFNVGDRVAYSAAFLKSTGQHTGPVPFLRGAVHSVESFGEHQLVAINWDGVERLGKVISPNLTLVDRIAIDAALAG